MSLPYFNLYPRDFEADTSHLSLEEDGAYNRLLRLCWMTPDCKIPADEAWIMRRCRAVTDQEKAAVKSVLSEFFTVSKQCYSNARLTREFIIANEAHEKRKNAGKKGGAAKSLKTNETASSNAAAMLKQPEPEPEPYKIDVDDGSAQVREAEICQPEPDTLRGKILTAIGVDPVSGFYSNGAKPKVMGGRADMLLVDQWIDLGLTQEEILTVIAEVMTKKRDGPPNGFSYFTPPMRQFAGAKAQAATRLQPSEGQNGTTHGNQSSGSGANRHGGGLTAGFAAVASRISARA